MNEYAVRLLTRMLEIYSPSGKEEAIANFIAKEMENLGFKVRKDRVGNVIGEIGHGHPAILLCGHMDTVTGFLPVKIEDSRLYGRGASDAKAPMAAMIVAASAFVNKENSGRIIVAGVVDEEGTSKGVKNLVEEGIQADYAIFGEPSGVDKITIGYRGNLRLRITCKTAGGHSAAHWLYENAIDKALEVWQEIKKIHFSSEKRESNFYNVDYCMTKISGGSGGSIVPSRCQINIDIRIPPPLSTTQVLEEVRKSLIEYQKVNPRVSTKLIVEDSVEPFEANPRSPLVQALSRAIREVRRKTPVLLRKTGTGDMNIFGKVMSVPVVTYGPGDATLSHTENEHIHLQEYLDGIEIIKRAISHLICLYKETPS